MALMTPEKYTFPKQHIDSCSTNTYMESCLYGLVSEAIWFTSQKQAKEKVYNVYLPVILIDIIHNLFNYTKCT